MQLLKGVNHVAIITADLDRFVEFYARVFDLDVVFSETTPAFRHAILRTGQDSWLHPVEIPGNAHGTARASMFERGHIDHLALTAASQEAFTTILTRAVEYGACCGPIEDLGAFHAFWLEDPDRMRVEVAVIVDATLTGIHEPRPLRPGRPGPRAAA